MKWRLRRAGRWVAHIGNWYLGALLPAKVIVVQPECWCGTNHLGDYWHDPTHGRIDRDIQDLIRERYGDDITLGQREALESTTQRRRDSGLSI